MTRDGIDRKDLLKLIGAGGAVLVGAGAGAGVWSRLTAFAAPEEVAAAAGTSLACVLSPERTEGPYFVDERLNRSDIRVDPSDNSVQAGVPLKLTIRTFDADRSCRPVAGATVDVWHANAQGAYSDVAQNGTGGKKFLRGLQKTDAGGAAAFTTIYPGWYQGRTIHIHFKVRLFDGASETYEFTSQIFFDEATNNAVMTLPAYNRGRTRDVLNANDNVYGSDGSRLLASASGNTSGYTATFDVGLSGLPASAGSTDAKLAASLTKAAFDRTANGQRRLTLTLDADETVAAELRLVRGSSTLTRRRFSELKAGTRKPALVIPKRVAAGNALLVVALEDAAGNTKTARRTVKVPTA
jgi:protocatechuate 3,4-dioxygenase beta subunit